MAHNGYFYPDDIIIEVIDGKRIGRVGWELPTIWTPESINAVFRVDFTTGWEMAREEFRKVKIDKWYKEVHPENWAENQAFSAWVKSGKSVTSFHANKLNAVIGARSETVR
jgi:hypothetical protein